MPTMEEIRAAMYAATLTGQGNYLPVGKHVARVEKFFYKKAGQNTPLGILLAEFKVVQSSNPEVQIETMTYSEGFDPAKSGWEDRLQKFLFSALGVDFRGARPAGAQELVVDIRFSTQFAEIEGAKLAVKYGQPPESFLVGRYVVAEGTPYETKKHAHITSIKWSPYVAPVQP